MRTKTMARRHSTGTMADGPATFSFSCFWFSPTPGPTPRLWLAVEVVVSLVWVSCLSKDGTLAGMVGCWVDFKVGGRYICPGLPMSEGASSVGSAIRVLGGGKCSWGGTFLK